MTPTEVITGARFQSLATVTVQAGLLPQAAHAMAGEWNPVKFATDRANRLQAIERADAAKLHNQKCIFVYADHLFPFLTRILPLLSHRFVLISHNGDTLVDRRIFEFLDDPRLVHVFAQNTAVNHPKLTGLPIGVPNDVDPVVLLAVARMAAPWSHRLPRIYCNFDIRTSLGRQGIRQRLVGRRDCVLAPRGTRLDYWREMSQFQYVLSPPGGGPDCFRTWEALYLRCVPIVERWPLGQPYWGVPVSEVDDIGNPPPCHQYVGLEFEHHCLRFSWWRDTINAKIP